MRNVADTASDSALMQPTERLVVKVGAKRSSINTGGFTTRIENTMVSGAENGADGGIHYLGGGDVYITAPQNYTGSTIVRLSTSLVIESLSCLGGGLSEISDSNVADGRYTVLTGTDLSSLDLSAIAIPDGCTLSLSEDKKTLYCTKLTKEGTWTGAAATTTSRTARTGSAAPAPRGGGKYVLTSGAGLSDASQFTPGEGIRGTLSAEDGELVLTIKPKGFVIIVS